MDWLSSTFWIAVLEIVWVNVLLSGDNAVVIALAARGLDARLQRAAVVSGSAAAIALCVLLTLGAVALLERPWLKLTGGLLLLGVAVQLRRGDVARDAARPADASVWAAVRTVLVADLVMSLDNVLAVAAAAASAPAPLRTPLLFVGLGLSIPLIAFGSTLLLRVMERVPLLVTLGAALLGWVAGRMVAADAGLAELPAWLGAPPGPAATDAPGRALAAGLAGASLVLLAGRWPPRP